MKKLIRTIIVLTICGIIIYYRKPVSTFLYKNFIFKKEITIPETTKYKKDLDFNYVKNTNDFYPKERQDILDILYTVINSGWTEFSFYCDDSYKECYNDVNAIARDDTILGQINNFVHPYNTYNTVSLSINNFGKVSILIEHVYSNEEINTIDKKINEIYNKLITPNMSDYDKIKKIHDYIINTTAYDQVKEKDNANINSYKYKSNTAYGPLINNISLCGGYTDAMALFLEKMNIKNYRVASSKHIWNLVYVNNEWKHLDLTWDDPVSKENILTHKFFLINYSSLKNLDKDQHNFDESVYSEGK